jgi:hypothetical protein
MAAGTRGAKRKTRLRVAVANSGLMIVGAGACVMMVATASGALSKETVASTLLSKQAGSVEFPAALAEDQLWLMPLLIIGIFYMFLSLAVVVSALLPLGTRACALPLRGFFLRCLG